jgi:ATP-dependent exoDNAse (exonuclease V) alpha subunit
VRGHSDVPILPRELNKEQRIALVREFVGENFVSKGMVADINLHQDEGNPHAHILLTMRDITADGFGLKNTNWNQRALIYQWRKSWADIQNRHLQKAGYDISVDHRSYIDRGIDLEPQIKMSPSTYNSDADLALVEDFKRIKRDNGKRLTEEPSIALKVLSRHSALFTEEDIHQFVNSHSEGAEQFRAVCDAIFKCKELISLGKGADGYNTYTTKYLAGKGDGIIGDIARKAPR